MLDWVNIVLRTLMCLAFLVLVVRPMMLSVVRPRSATSRRNRRMSRRSASVSTYTLRSKRSRSCGSYNTRIPSTTTIRAGCTMRTSPLRVCRA